MWGLECFFMCRSSAPTPAKQAQREKHAEFVWRCMYEYMLHWCKVCTGLNVQTQTLFPIKNCHCLRPWPSWGRVHGLARPSVHSAVDGAAMRCSPAGSRTLCHWCRSWRREKTPESVATLQGTKQTDEEKRIKTLMMMYSFWQFKLWCSSPAAGQKSTRSLLPDLMQE